MGKWINRIESSRLINFLGFSKNGAFWAFQLYSSLEEKGQYQYIWAPSGPGGLIPLTGRILVEEGWFSSNPSPCLLGWSFLKGPSGGADGSLQSLVEKGEEEVEEEEMSQEARGLSHHSHYKKGWIEVRIGQDWEGRFSSSSTFLDFISATSTLSFSEGAGAVTIALCPVCWAMKGFSHSGGFSTISCQRRIYGNWCGCPQGWGLVIIPWTFWVMGSSNVLFGGHLTWKVDHSVEQKVRNLPFFTTNPKFRPLASTANKGPKKMVKGVECFFLIFGQGNTQKLGCK